MQKDLFSFFFLLAFSSFLFCLPGGGLFSNFENSFLSLTFLLLYILISPTTPSLLSLSLSTPRPNNQDCSTYYFIFVTFLSTSDLVCVMLSLVDDSKVYISSQSSLFVQVILSSRSFMHHWRSAVAFNCKSSWHCNANIFSQRLKFPKDWWKTIGCWDNKEKEEK